ncbi:AAA family ATPase [Methylovulum miyakonense]|uniref:AAA family ATPase n=1 Tax=Methylovulum miyakonense TaxID=645578 RepID=UPI000381D019|nr:AAA family ATPase [Methylovulum miyakonense]
MSKVKYISVSGYKSIRELLKFPLKNLNVLIGANGAGKSNFISVFRLLAEMAEQNLQMYVSLQGGSDAILHFGRGTSDKLKIYFEFTKLISASYYECILVPSEDNKLIFDLESRVFGSKSEYRVKTGDYEAALLQTSDSRYIPSWRIYHFHDTSDKAKVKQRHATNDNLLLKPDAANLAAYLRMLFKDHNDHYQRIVSTIRLVAPFFGNFVQRPGEPEYIELEWTQKGQPDTPFKAHVLSDGTLRFICLATLLLQPLELLPVTILIDEPELGLHPYAISVLADIFKQVAEDKQLIVSTQSVELVNHLSPEDIIVVDQEDGASVFKRFTSEELSGWLEDYAMGELWKSNVLGGRP